MRLNCDKCYLTSIQRTLKVTLRHSKYSLYSSGQPLSLFVSYWYNFAF